MDSVTNCEAVIRTVPDIVQAGEAIADTASADGVVYASLQEIEQADGLIIGSPTRFGTTAAPLKHFLEQTTAPWLTGALTGKPAAAFTSTGTLHGGQEMTLIDMLIPLLHHGMLITGIPYSEPALRRTASGGTPYGASHVAGDSGSQPLTRDESDLATALGQRVATIAKKLGNEH